MSEWKIVRLSDLAIIKYGKNQKKVQSEEGTVPIYGTGGLMGYASEALYEKESVLIGRKGTIDKIRYVNFPFWTVDTLFYTIINENKIVPKFLYYNLCTVDFMKMNEGTTIPSLRTETLNKMELSIPDMQTQKQIASILSALDVKIELNNRINENLEQQAQAFFTDLFITNAKLEWKTGTVSDLGDVVGGGTPSKKVEEYYTNDGIAWITPKDLSNDKSKFITHGETDITDLGLAKSGATLMPRGSVLFSSRAPIGYIAIADGQVSTNQGFKSIVPFDNVGTAYVYYFLKENLSAIENVASGSTFKEVSGGTMKNFPAVIPDDDTLAKFKQFCSPLLEQQRALEYENRYLASLRDTLLPKLMNGEIDVSEVKI